MNLTVTPITDESPYDTAVQCLLFLESMCQVLSFACHEGINMQGETEIQEAFNGYGLLGWMLSHAAYLKLEEVETERKRLAGELDQVRKGGAR
jgi:hypothetical protein